jgi:DNA modification methylase
VFNASLRPRLELYFGLRDYNTATWEGGDAACSHRPASTPARRGLASSTLTGGQSSNGHQQEGYKDLCGKCGARRIDRQIGLEETPEAYVARLVDVFREVRRVLHPSGTLWLNIGDSYAGSGRGLMGDCTPSDRGNAKQGTNRGTTIGQFNRPDWGDLKSKDLIGIPWMTAFALRADGWYLRSEVIWHKKAPMPESVTDRPTKAHEQVFLLAKSPTYYYDADAIREPLAAEPRAREFGNKHALARNVSHLTGNMKPGVLYTDNPQGANRRSVWTLGPENYAGSHFATFPTKLVEPCILAGSKVGDTVLDPFSGSGTTGAVALQHGRAYIGIDLSAAYNELAHKRIAQTQPNLLTVYP